jgi:flagellar export protein FliJ
MQILKKIKRVGPLMKVKQDRVDAESALLIQIRLEKQKIVNDMRENQRKYMRGVEELNQTRSSKMRDNLETLELGLDYIKSEWYRLYKEVQVVEGREQKQVLSVLEAERDLKSLERLKEKYEVEYKKELSKIEQKQLDEISIRQFNQRQARS